MSRNYAMMDLEESIDAWLDEEDYDPEADEAAYADWLDHEYEIWKERKLYGDDF